MQWDIACYEIIKEILPYCLTLLSVGLGFLLGKNN